MQAEGVKKKKKQQQNTTTTIKNKQPNPGKQGWKKAAPSYQNVHANSFSLQTSYDALR